MKDSVVGAAAAVAPVAGKWITDANVLSLVTSMNAKQAAAADIELRTWHLDTVRSFAAAVARQHADLQHSVDSLAASIHLTPVAPALSQSVNAAMQARIDSMTMSKGTALDRAFVDEQAANQATMLDYVQRLSSVAERPEVQALMATVTSKLSDELGRTRALQSTFTKADSIAAANVAANAAAGDSAGKSSRRRRP